MRSVRVLLPTALLALIAAALGTVWVLTDYYNRKNTEQLATRIQQELAHRIHARVNDVLSTPHRLNATMAQILAPESIDPSKTDEINHYFQAVLSTYPHHNAVFLGTVEGAMYGARWSIDRQRCEVMVANPSTNGALSYFQVDQNGKPATLVERAEDYDPRTRSWYRKALAADGPVWSPIYLDFATETLVMTAARPFVTNNGNRVGVLGAGIQFLQIDQFLQQLEVGATGIAYLMERDGTLISASTRDQSVRLVDSPPQRLAATESPNTLIQHSARQLVAEFGSIARVTANASLPIQLPEGKALGSVFPIGDGAGLDWLGVIVVPESDYMAGVAEKNQTALLAVLIVALSALLAGLVSARFLTGPLTQLARATDGIARGTWDAPLDVKRHDEFGALARAFDAMRSQLRHRIHELQSTRNALIASEARYARAQEAARVVTWYWGLEEESIRWTEQANPLLADAPGDHEVSPREYLEIIHPEDRDYVATRAEEAIAGAAEFDVEYRLNRDDGPTRWVTSKGDVIRSSDNIPVAFTGVLLDISERKRLEAQLREAQKMDAVGRLAGGVAHDFNNLLQAILGFAELARDATPESNPVHQDLTEIIQAGSRATELVGQLLAFSRRQMLKLGNIALRDVVRDMGKLLGRLINETIVLRVELEAQDAVVRADRSQVEQVLINLCINARDAMPDGGTLVIAIDSRSLSAEECITLPWARPGDYHILRVTDTGCGMNPETLAVIFEPFFTTKDVGKGTGLGLATVYGIVEQHKGLLHVTSTPDEGTTFEIYFPAADGVPTPSVEPVPVAIPRGGETILVAEDDSAVRQLASRILTQAGYTVLAARDGMDAIMLFDAHREEIGAAFLDVVMPGKSGRSVFEHIRQTAPELPIMFASGYAEGPVHTDFILENRLTLIKKPYTPQILLASLYEILHLDESEN